MKRLLKIVLKIVGVLAVFGSIGGILFDKYKKIEKKYKFIVKFDDKEIEYNEDVYDETIAVLFSDVVIDLTKNDILEDDAIYEVYSAFSEVTIYVPENFDVYLEGKTILSDVDLDLGDTEKDSTLNLFYNANFTDLKVRTK